MSRKSRLLKQQKLGHTSGYTSEGSPYWEYVERQNQRTKDGLLVENKFANPGALSDDTTNSLWGKGSKPELAELIIERFTNKFGQFPILSAKENQVLNVYLQTGSINEVMLRCRITRSSCNTYMARISKKFKRLLPLVNY